jgi:hypothetical protein
VALGLAESIAGIVTYENDERREEGGLGWRRGKTRRQGRGREREKVRLGGEKEREGGGN